MIEARKFDCYIIGGGPEGKKGFDRVPVDAQKIVLNEAIIRVDQFKWKNFIWMISDHNVIDTDIFINFYPQHHKRLHASGQVAERVRVANQFQENPWMTMPSFWEKREIEYTDFMPMEGGIFRGGGTVAGCALHRCYWWGQRAVLCGIDMGGRENAHRADVIYRHDHFAGYRKLLDAFIQCCLPDTISLTATRLAVKEVKE